MNWILFISTFLIGAFFGLCVLALFVANHTSDSVSMEEYKELEQAYRLARFENEQLLDSMRAAEDDRK